ncbi:nucleotide excision repair endonuclease [Heyndrickxia ginsengihumi]|uniref:nucleotide excision repair endonuclease n=1 Tax=Heyndrickxia ginsengihumi TaxID=363870 RepID=UPI003D1FBD6A
MITIRELIENKLLSIPPINQVLTVDELKDGGRFEQGGGVYIFYSEYGEPLYVGISNNLSKRICEHLHSKKGNPDLIRYTSIYPRSYVTVFYESDKRYQELYESYLIAVLNPRYNVQKTGREKL